MIQKRDEWRYGYSDEDARTWLELALYIVFAILSFAFLALIDFLIKHTEGLFTLLIISLVILLVSIGLHFNCYSVNQTCFDLSNAFVRPWR